MWCLAIVLFFSREVLGKRWGLSTSCGASPWVECNVVSSFSEILLKQQLASAFYLIITSYLPSHSFCYNHRITFILSETHQWALLWLHQNRVWGTETMFEEPGKHDCIVGVMISLLIYQNSRRKTIFYNNLVQAYLFVYYYFKHALFILT
jgi:hypothetical protein